MFECCNCLIQLKSAKLMFPCNHVVCDKCFEQVNHDKRKKTYTCVQCLQEYPESKCVVRSQVSQVSLMEVDNDDDHKSDISLGYEGENGFDSRNNCQHLSTAKAGSKTKSSYCRHCEKLFCPTCEREHKEQLRCEILAKIENVHQKVNGVFTDEKGPISEAKNQVEQEAKRASQQVVDYCEDLIEQFRYRIENFTQRILLDEIESMKQHELGNIEAVMTSVVESAETPAAIEALSVQDASSFTFEQLSEMRALVAEKQKGVASIDKLADSSVSFQVSRIELPLYAIDELTQVDRIKRCIQPSKMKKTPSFTMKTTDRIEDKYSIFDAIESKDVKKVKDLLVSASDLAALLKTKNEKNLTPFQFALEVNDCSIIQVFLKRQLVHVENDRDHVEEATLRAATNGDLQLLEALLNYDHNLLHVRDMSTSGLIHRASRRDFNAMLKHLLNLQPDLISKPGFLGRQPLHFAVESPSSRNIRTLLARGANVRARDENGDLPIHLACGLKKCPIESIRALIEIDPETAEFKDANGDDLIEIARSNGHLEAHAFLADYFAKKM